MIIRVETGNRIDDYMDLRDERIQKIIKIMKIKPWSFIRYVPNKEDIRHNYCILPVSDISEKTMRASKIGAYIFNFSLVEEKAILEKPDFVEVVNKLKRVPEPLRGYIGPLPKDEVIYRFLKINDELAPLPPKNGKWV